MKNIIITTIILATTAAFMNPTVEQPVSDANEILEKIDKNMSSKNRIVESSMIIKGKRRDRTVTSKSWSIGDSQAFTEYLSPARDKGTKMLKLEDRLWIYTPATDRTIQISGHLLRQSIMGSDLSYEDMMEDRKLQDVYNAALEGEEEIDGRLCKVLLLTSKVQDIAYHSQKLWVDGERFVPLKEERFGKSGKLLKRTVLKDVKNIQGRWFPTTILYKDMLKSGDGTEFRVLDIKFDQDIPDYLFTKAALKK